jgi:hypothetical protein
MDADPKAPPDISSAAEAADPAVALVRLFFQSGASVLHDDRGRNLARIVLNGREAIVQLPSKQLHRHLVALFFHCAHQIPKRSVTSGAMDFLAAMADHAPPQPVYNRFAKTADAVWLDLADGTGRVVRIDRCGWELVLAPAGPPRAPPRR